MQRASLLPDFDDCNGWYNVLPPPPAARQLEDDHTADWLVIGAGFTGLSAARTLGGHFPDSSIALIDADRVGNGASGRNAGFAIDVPFLQEAHGDAGRGTRVFALHRAGQVELDRLVSEHQIDCQWRRRGKYMVAVGDRAKDVLGRTQEFLEALGADSTVLGAAALKERLGTSYYQMGLYSPGTYLMNPAALTRGLAASLPENISLFENSPVLQLRLAPDIVARTNKGRIGAKGVVLATDGFSEAFGIVQQRIFNIMTYASLSRPLLEPSETDLLGGTPDWGVHPAGAAGATIRRTQDNRIWHRVGFAYSSRMHVSEATLRRYRRYHTDDFKARFPQLGAPNFEHTYAGNLCMSRNSEPIFKCLSDNVFIVACQNGIGVSKGTIHGKLVADWAAGKSSELLDYARAYGAPCKIPREPFLGLGVAARLRLEAFRGRME